MIHMATATTIRTLRLAAQRIEGSELTGAAEVVRWMLAMQAQDLAGAKWSVGLRAPGTTLADVDAALANGSVIRSWPMRGTLHLVAAEDIGWMLELTAPRTVQSLARRYRELDLDEATFERAGEVAVGVLEGGRALPRADLFEFLEKDGISTAGQRAPHILGRLCQKRTLCLGPMLGVHQAVVLMDEWVPNPRTLERDEALGEFVRRFFLSHGPATIRDFTWWTKLLVRDAAVGLAVARGQLAEIVIDGTSYWMAPGLPDRASRDVHLLPGFDEYMLGYQDRSAILAAEHWQAIVPGNNGVFQPTIISAGRVVGTWRRKAAPAKVTLTPMLFEPLSTAAKKSLRASAAGYGQFLGSPIDVSTPS
jgi:Winged helix DNA-binding domain